MATYKGTSDSVASRKPVVKKATTTTKPKATVSGPDAARSANANRSSTPKAAPKIKVSQVTINDMLSSVKKGGMKDLQRVIAMNRGGRGNGPKGGVAGGSATAEVDEAFRRLYPKQWNAIVSGTRKTTKIKTSPKKFK